MKDMMSMKPAMMIATMLLKHESPKRKLGIMVTSVGLSILSLACAIFWLSRADSAEMFDKDAYVTDWRDDRSAFNQCMGFRGVSLEDIEDICDKTPCTEDIDTMWKATFFLNGFVMLALSGCYMLLAVGTFRVMPRVVGSCCGRLWTWLSFVACIVTAVAQFSKQGRLCAKVEIESAY